MSEDDVSPAGRTKPAIDGENEAEERRARVVEAAEYVAARSNELNRRLA
jgi:hypothetical protein